jgi:3-keto-L-gulonate-6-phosphate decarboxylase
MTGVADPVRRAHELRNHGISLVLYHRSIDQELTEGALWDETACRTVQEMCALGLDVAVAGGMNLNLLPKLAGLPIYGLVIGRGITGQADPAAAAKAIFERRAELWPA